MIFDDSAQKWNNCRIGQFCAALARRYPFAVHESIGTSVMGKPLHLLRLGSGNNRALFHGVHHANEWITAPLLLRFAAEYASAASSGGMIFDEDARQLIHNTELAIVPSVNPDGMELVTGTLFHGPYYARAKEIAAQFPDIPFPDGWKANIEGIDLNLQYPAGWMQAKIIKFSQGFCCPAPRDYVGAHPLCAPEAAALYRFTCSYCPSITLSYHTQGREIYWQFQNFAPSMSKKLAAEFSRISGYAAADVPYASSFAGYKDWFLQEYRLPAFTIEAGFGNNPLPMTSFEKIYLDNLGIFVRSLRTVVVTSDPFCNS